MSARAKKYLFDTDFAAGEPRPSISSAELAAKVAEAEALGYRKGFAAAQAEARLDAERRAAVAVERIAAAITDLARQLSALEARLEAEAIEVAVAVGSKLAPALIAREPLAEMAELAGGCFRNLVAAPHVVVRVSDDMLAAAREKLAEIAKTAGFDGRLVVLVEPDLATGDCRIEWADGGINRDSATVKKKIEAAVSRHVSVRREPQVGAADEISKGMSHE